MDFQEKINMWGTDPFPVSFFTICYDRRSRENWKRKSDEKFSTVGKTLPHWHRHQEVILVETGKIRFTINSFKGEAAEGDFLVINGMDTHSLVGDGTVRVAQFDSNLKRDFKCPSKMRFNLQDQDKLIQKDSCCYEQIYREFNEAREAFMNENKDYYIMTIGCLYKLTYFVNQITPSYQASKTITNKVYFDYDRLETLFEYVDNNYYNRISLEEAATIANFSPHYFCKFFKRMTGVTFFDYLNEYRCEKADLLLRTTDKSIMEIALESGFSSCQYFSKIYHRFRGYSPSETRKMENLAENHKD